LIYIFKICILDIILSQTKESEMTSEVKLLSAIALATAGLMTCDYVEEIAVPIDMSPTSSPVSRNQYLTKKFPQFASELKKLPMDLNSPTEIWKVGKNEWHSLYQVGVCSKLPEDWVFRVAHSFEQFHEGSLKVPTKDNPISVRMRFNSQGYVHIFLTEYNPSYFSDKPWYKFWNTPSNVKSGYIMAINCDYHK